MVSNDVIQVKDAPDMNLLEAVRHFTFLLSEQNFEFVKGTKPKGDDNLKREIEAFSTDIGDALAADLEAVKNACDTEDSIQQLPSTLTANAATAMFQKYSKDGVSKWKPIDQDDHDYVIVKARDCLAWARDPLRAAVPGAENITNDQAAAIMLYTQETCLYPRLNTALRNHDIAALEPFLPYMKLLLSGLYQLPLARVPTYRGVKLELYKTYNQLVGQVWSWWSFSSTSKDKNVLLDSTLFLGNFGKRTMFCLNAVGVDIAPFSAMPDEAEVLLLPGLPLVNHPGENPEKNLWTFEIETPGTSSEGDPPPVMIDYVHPEWNTIFHDES